MVLSRLTSEQRALALAAKDYEVQRVYWRPVEKAPRRSDGSCSSSSSCLAPYAASWAPAAAAGARGALPGVLYREDGDPVLHGDLRLVLETRNATRR